MFVNLVTRNIIKHFLLIFYAFYRIENNKIFKSCYLSARQPPSCIPTNHPANSFNVVSPRLTADFRASASFRKESNETLNAASLSGESAEKYLGDHLNDRKNIPESK